MRSLIAFAFSLVVAQGGAEPIRGVNLGGWLVLEPWITPSLFAEFRGKPEAEMAVDEYTFTQILKEKAVGKLKRHWESWVTERDFAILATAGINHVRIPVGYWAFNRTASEPWVDGSFQHLVRGVHLAKRHNIKVMIDIHGAPLSQNGFDNSGRAGAANFLNDDLSGPRMLDVLDKVARRFSTPEFRSTVTSIQVVNEPASWLLNMDKVKQFYDDAYRVIRRHNKDVYVAFHDAFIGVGGWKNLAQKRNVMLDTHIYNVFDKYLVTMTPDMHLRHTCNFVEQLAQSKALAPTVVGEWSLATTDCTLHLNGFMKGSRYVGNFDDHSSPRLEASYNFNADKCAQYDHVDKFPPGHAQFLKQFFDRQMGVYENAGSGWFFWNFKAENSPEWNFLLGVQEGWISLPAKTSNTC